MAYKFITQPPCGTPDEPSQTSQVRLRLRLRLVCSRIQITILINNLRPSNTHAARTHTHMYTCKHRHTHRHTQGHTYSPHSTSTCFASFISPTSYNVLQFCLLCVCLSVCLGVPCCVPVCVLSVCVNFCGTLIQLGSPRPLSINFSKTRLIAQRALFLIYFSSLHFFFANNNFFAFVFMVVVIAVTLMLLLLLLFMWKTIVQKQCAIQTV